MNIKRLKILSLFLALVSVFGCDANGEIELKFNYGIMKK